MKDITNTTDIRTWVIDWLENRFSITRECIESSEKLADVCCYDDVDRFFLEYDAESDFGIPVPDGAFDECESLNDLVCKIKEIKDKDAKCNFGTPTCYPNFPTDC
ncbi:MAG: hypothetical protein IKT27_05795 [Clostridia bacterium]|nr:hypothetical protein [Clostridia bacterium]